MADQRPERGSAERKALPPKGIGQMLLALGIKDTEIQLYGKYVPPGKKKDAAVVVMPVAPESRREGYVIEFRHPVAETRYADGQARAAAQKTA